MFKFEETSKMSKEAMDAVSTSCAVASKGMQDIATEATEFTKKAYEDGAAVAEKLVAVKSFDKAVEIQTEYAKSAYETFVAQSTKFSELYTALAKDSYKPFEDVATKFKA